MMLVVIIDDDKQSLTVIGNVQQLSVHLIVNIDGTDSLYQDVDTWQL